MDSTLYTALRPKNIIIIFVLTVIINAILFMGLPALTRIADRKWDDKKDIRYMITPREDPKPPDDTKEKRLRHKELRHIPMPKIDSGKKETLDTRKFVFDTSSGEVGGLAVALAPAEGIDIDVDDITLSIGDVDTPPSVIRAPPVSPPYDAVRKGLTGRVFVRVRVGVDGKPTNIRAKRSEPPEVLEVFGEAAEKAVAKYRFEPARLGGEAVPVWALQPISFEVY